MACPISIGDAQQIVHWAVEIYQKIQNAEDEIKQAGIMMEELDDYLGWLRKLIEAKTAVANQLDPHWKELMDRITQRMGKIKKVCQGIHAILKIYLENLPMSKFVFPFGKNPKILRGLMEELQRYENALYKELWSANLIPDVPTVVSPQSTTGAVVTPPSIARPLPTPSPKPVKKDCRIIFVDPHNVGRSKVAEAYSSLLRAWTMGSGQKWPILTAHSAGMALKHRSDCAEIVQQVKYPIPAAVGNHPPPAVAMDSLLDNKYYNAQYKASLRETMMKSRSRGINSTIFNSYDYILVFIQREFKTLLELKKALIAAHGAEIAPKGKARIIHLGAYISRDGNPISITDAKKGENGEHSRAEWNKTTSQIKLAIKAFLKDELDWKEPPKAPQAR